MDPYQSTPRAACDWLPGCLPVHAYPRRKRSGDSFCTAGVIRHVDAPAKGDLIVEAQLVAKTITMEACPDESGRGRWVSAVSRAIGYGGDSTGRLLEVINEVLSTRGLLLSGGTMVDATLIAAPPSTKSRAGQRDPAMRQTRKGQQWYFGMKRHVGADVHSGLVHTAAVTAANVADVRILPSLLRADDRAVFGDAGYVQNGLKRAARAAGVLWAVALKGTRGRPLKTCERERIVGSRRFGRGRSTCFGSSSVSLAIARCVIGDWQRMRRSCSLCWG